MKERLLIIGAGGHGKVCADIALKMNKWNEIFFLDDESKEEVMGVKVLDTPSNFKKYINDSDFFVAIGDNSTRKKIIEELLLEEIQLPTLIHPNTIISQNIKIDYGTVVMAGVIINCCTEIGKGCIINTGVTIDHDCLIKNYIHISPGTNIAGTVIIENETWIGIGSIVSNNILITNNCKLGAGTIVIKDITIPGIYVGIPAKRIKKRNE